MIELVVIRRGADESKALVLALAAGFPGLVDVTRWDQVRLVRVDSAAQVTVAVDGHALDEVGAVLVLGLPPSGLAAPTRDEQYAQQEREQALLAALAACVHVKILNRPAVFAWNHALLDGSAQLRILDQLGWRTPSITHAFDLAGTAIAKLREPDPDDAGPLALLVIGRRRHARAPGANRNATARPDLTNPGLDTLIARTQLYLRDEDLDLVTIPIAETAGGPIAYGFHVGPSADLPREALHHLVREAMQ